MPRRYADYLPSDGFTTLNTISTIGSFVLGASTLSFLWNVWKSWRYGALVTVDDPWGFGNSLEWATTCPPPLRNFDRMPRIRSERPAFDAKYGSLVADLGRDVPQRATRTTARALRDELRHGDRHVARVADVRPDGGARRPGKAVDYHPPPQSGARPINVPDPDEIRRPRYATTTTRSERLKTASAGARKPPGGGSHPQERGGTLTGHAHRPSWRPGRLTPCGGSPARSRSSHPGFRLARPSRAGCRAAWSFSQPS